jgi:hypothetical protein
MHDPNKESNPSQAMKQYYINCSKVNVKQSCYRPGVAQRVPGS